MKFQVGKFTCEMSLNDRGAVQAKWRPETPKYLTKEERAQWQTALSTFLSKVTRSQERTTS